ncbi:MAG: hypothetical protein C5B54_11960 [Acidobacteria bacterium]|nr:MAG: hypothetical protein C5B54_11960 [Acidobacteriota bacterium]
MKVSIKVILFFFCLTTIALADKFYPDDPVWQDPDRITISKPKVVESDETGEFIKMSFGDPANTKVQTAQNINTLDEIPDSTWFTNRIGQHSFSNEDLVRGPNHLEGPDLSMPWKIIKAKSSGVSPGFVIEDGRGDTYFVKFDAADYPQLSTSAEVVCTKFFYAFGYNVPENYLVFVPERQFEIAPDTKIGKDRPFTNEYLHEILKGVAHRRDGTVQVVASFKLDGAIGPFQYYGTRSDDANDIIPHENRRELRGLRVFASWLNHYDIRSVNTLDTFVTTDEKNKTGYVKHYLLDFGSTFGSAGIQPAKRRTGYEYTLEWTPILKSAATFGLWDRPWWHYQYPDYAGVGRFESEHFEPQNWKPNYPNSAFNRMQIDDALWATAIVMKFDDDKIRALVKTGHYEDPRAEDYLVKTLIDRRKKIISYYLSQTNPLYDFRIVNSKVEFTNLGEVAQISKTNTYQYQWYRFDNQAGSQEGVGGTGFTKATAIPIPKNSASYLLVKIHTQSPGEPNWKKEIRVYVRNKEQLSVIGIERADNIAPQAVAENR